MAIPIACECGKTLKVRDEQLGKTVKCPFCGQLLKADSPPDELVEPEFVEPEPEMPKDRSRERLLWSGFAFGLAIFAMLSIQFVNKRQRDNANQAVVQNTSDAQNLLDKGRHDEAISLLEGSLTTRNATEFSSAKALLEQARVKKRDATEAKFIASAEKWLDEGKIEDAITSLKSRVGDLNDSNRKHVTEVVKFVEAVSDPEFAKAFLSVFPEDAMAGAESNIEEITSKLQPDFKGVKERYKQNLLAALPAERARREEAKRQAEAERLARAEAERLEKLEKERAAEELKKANQEARARVAAERAAKEAARLQLEERNKIDLSGFGQQATEEFFLKEGLAVVTLFHNGSSNFMVKLLDSGGENTEHLANEIGHCFMSRAVRVEKTGNHILNVKADGKWQIVIRQPIPHDADPSYSFEGTGTMASRQFNLGDILYRFKFKHSGKGHFSVKLLDDRGKYIEGIVNEIGECDGSQAVNIKDDGTYIFDIKADGDWKIEIEP